MPEKIMDFKKRLKPFAVKDLKNLFYQEFLPEFS
jgi:hypothetical protein